MFSLLDCQSLLAQVSFLLVLFGSFTNATAQNDSGFKFLEVKVVDPEGKPLPDVPVDVRVDGSGFLMPTDERGMIGFNAPDGDNTRLSLAVQQPGYVAVGARWRRGEQLPEQYSIKLQSGTTIGGIVHDQTGKPVEGAEVKAGIFWSDSISRGQLRPTISGVIAHTDENGKWHYESAPTSRVNLQFKFSHPDFISSRGYSLHGWSFEQLQAQDQIYVLEKGISINGRVLNPAGKPVVGAKVTLGRSRFDSDRQIATTNEAGEYRFTKLKAGQTILTVSSPEWAPELRVVETKPQTENPPIDFHLQPPQTVRLRVVDPAGKPLPGVTIIPEHWRRYRSLEDPFERKQTGEAGIWEWHAAPTDTVQYSIFARGRFGVSESRSAFLPSDELQDVVMYPAAQVTGIVIDKVTRKPIDRFRCVEGIWWRDDSSRPILQRSSSLNETLQRNGTFNFVMNDDGVKYLIQVEAEGYRPSRSRAILPQEGDVQLQFELEPSAPIRGVVNLPTGEPAEGVQIDIATKNQRVHTFNGRPSSWYRTTANLTDKQGRFELPVVEAGFMVLFTHDAGVAQISEAELTENPKIVLQPWARVEGTVASSLQIETKRFAAMSAYYHAKDQDAQRALASWYYRQETDDNGKFVFECVPPWPMAVGSLERIGSGPNHSFQPTNTQLVNLTAGKTTTVQVGGTGRQVRGQLVKPRDLDPRVSWQLASVTLTRQVETAKQYRPLFTSAVDSQGRFLFRDVSDGSYELSAKLYSDHLSPSGNRWQLVATGDRTGTVSGETKNDTTAPIDFGMLKLDLVDGK